MSGDKYVKVGGTYLNVSFFKGMLKKDFEKAIKATPVDPEAAWKAIQKAK